MGFPRNLKHRGMQLDPLALIPTYKNYVWGGDRINRVYHRGLPPGVYAESWEVSDRPEGMSVVADGPQAGRTLHDLVAEFGPSLVGLAGRGDRFPLLVKLIDARETLSVQVHPDDDTARRFGGEAKTEMWYVLQADPGAHVFRGLKSGVTVQDLAAALNRPDVSHLLEKVPVRAGDTIYVPGGCVHAIGAGCLLLEVQQNSNTTYRLNDWGRVDAQGKPRELHVTEGLRVVQPRTPPNDHRLSPYFSFAARILDRSGLVGGNESSFEIIFLAAGDAKLGSRRLVAGQSVLIPAQCPPMELALTSDTSIRFVSVSLGKSAQTP